MTEPELEALSQPALVHLVRVLQARVTALETELAQLRGGGPPPKTPANSSVPPAKSWKAGRVDPPPGSERPLEVLAVVRNTDNPDGVGLEFLARDMGGVHRLREVIRRLVEQ